MQEGDSLSFGADTRLLVDELDPGAPATIEGTVEIVDREANVMNPGAPLGDKASDRGFVIFGLEELDQGLPGAQSNYTRTIGVIERDFPQTQHVTKER